MAENVKMLYILDSFPDPHAGTEGQFWLLYRLLDRASFNPDLLLLRASEFLAKHIPANSLRTLNVYSLRTPSSWWRILRSVLQARASGVRVAHIFFNDSALVFPILLKLVGIRVITSRRDLGIWYTPARIGLLRINRRFTDAVIVNCEAVKEVVRRTEGYPSELVSVIYNGLAREPHSCSTAISDRAHANLGLAETARLIVIVANLRPLKRIEDAVRALAKLDPGSRDLHLVVCGEDREGLTTESHMSELRRISGSIGVEGRVHFLGKLEDPGQLIGSAEICLLCSETEGLSNTIIEYMAAGKPVVCTNVGGNGELVRHGENGFLYPAGDVSALVNSLERILAEPSLGAKFGARSRDLAANKFAPLNMVRAHVQIYRHVLAPRYREAQEL